MSAGVSQTQRALETLVSEASDGIMERQPGGTSSKAKAGLQGMSAKQLSEGAAKLEGLLARSAEAGLTAESSAVLQRAAALLQRMRAALGAAGGGAAVVGKRGLQGASVKRASIFKGASLKGSAMKSKGGRGAGVLGSVGGSRRFRGAGAAPSAPTLEPGTGMALMRAPPTTYDAAVEEWESGAVGGAGQQQEEEEEEEEEEEGGPASLSAMSPEPKAKPVFWGVLLTGPIKFKKDGVSAVQMRALAWKPQFFVLHSAEQAPDVRLEVFSEQFDPVAAFGEDGAAAGSGRSRSATLFSTVVENAVPKPHKTVPITPDSLIMRSRLAPLALQLISPCKSRDASQLSIRVFCCSWAAPDRNQLCKRPNAPPRARLLLPLCF